MQGVIVIEKSIAANSTDANIFAGDPFATVSTATICSAGLTASATGLTVQLSAGGRLVVNSAAPPVSTVMPKVPDDFYYTFGALPAETLTCRVTNTTAGALTVRAVVQMADG